MKTLYIFLFSAVLTISLSLNAQTTTDFVLDADTMLSEGNTIAIASTLTKVGDTLTWQQESSGTTDATIFTISSTSGTWDSTTSIGDISYTATVNGYQIIFSIIGDISSGLNASVEIVIPDEENEVLELVVNQLSYL